ncbi:uncharacterized protein BDR25DRAFT_356026 [Lindgomyces ingoldianus]|uniref:Uncharacterized protein n=1 Tax=Lindgomyces ingoldianus TaxID=673940 RepID=A0ACB6QUM6_9PLEO|nr:uncharacterized protein BDR25DRAFT_356026 [Lindgomyces ingoldianus]KAF2469775.1 hypothetical protein BDR25DRAFT_356026 [Lindgomyces ingoldianus]
MIYTTWPWGEVLAEGASFCLGLLSDTGAQTGTVSSEQAYGSWRKRFTGASRGDLNKEFAPIHSLSQAITSSLKIALLANDAINRFHPQKNYCTAVSTAKGLPWRSTLDPCSAAASDYAFPFSVQMIWSMAIQGIAIGPLYISESFQMSMGPKVEFLPSFSGRVEGLTPKEWLQISSRYHYLESSTLDPSSHRGLESASVPPLL